MIAIENLPVTTVELSGRVLPRPRVGRDDAGASAFLEIEGTGVELHGPPKTLVAWLRFAAEKLEQEIHQQCDGSAGV